MPSLAIFKWVAIGLLTLLLVIAVQFGLSQRGKIDGLTKDRDTALQSAVAWQEANKAQADLAIKTAEARGQERQDLLIIRDAAGTAKEGISHAPGADDPYRYSDSAYRFMRASSEVVPGAPGPEAGVGQE